MLLKHKVIKEFQYLSPEKKIFILKIGTILENYTYKTKSEVIPIDKDIIDNNPEFFEVVDWKAELLSFMKSIKVPQPSVYCKKLIPFIDDFILSSIQSNDNTTSVSLDDINKKMSELNTFKNELIDRELEIKRKEADYSTLDIKKKQLESLKETMTKKETELNILNEELNKKNELIKDKEDELNAREDRILKKEKSYKYALNKIEKEENDIRDKNKSLKSKELELQDKTDALNSRERQIDNKELQATNLDEKYKQLQEKINKDIEKVQQREKELQEKTKSYEKDREELDKIIEEKTNNIYSEKYENTINELKGIEKDVNTLNSIALSLSNFNHPIIKTVMGNLLTTIS